MLIFHIFTFVIFTNQPVTSDAMQITVLNCYIDIPFLQCIDHVYVTLTTLWKFFYYSPKCTQSLKEVQKVLDFPELKIVKP